MFVGNSDPDFFFLNSGFFITVMEGKLDTVSYVALTILVSI